MIPEPSADDLARDAEADYILAERSYDAWIRRAVAAEARVNELEAEVKGLEEAAENYAWDRSERDD